MDFEEIDQVQGDTLAPGDIISVSDNFHQVRAIDGEDLDKNLVYLSTYNLSTGDEDEVSVWDYISYPIFRAF
jgi:hypothetical protein